MNPITKAIDDLKFRIPGEILLHVFTAKNYRWRDTPISTDEQIKNLVIRPRVLVDCNLVGGTQAMIPLDGIQAQAVDAGTNLFTTVYNIPKTLTDGRSIMSVLSINYATNAQAAMVNGMAGMNPRSINASGLAGMAMMDSFSPMPITSTARVQLIGENTVIVRDTTPMMGNSFLRCTLGNDDQLNNIQMRSIPYFCKLVELAVKSYIYNYQDIKTDMGQLSGGMELGRFKEIISSYADKEEAYQEYLMKKWAKVAMMNDTEGFTRHIKSMVGPSR